MSRPGCGPVDGGRCTRIGDAFSRVAVFGLCMHSAAGVSASHAAGAACALWPHGRASLPLVCARPVP